MEALYQLSYSPRMGTLPVYQSTLTSKNQNTKSFTGSAQLAYHSIISLTRSDLVRQIEKYGQRNLRNPSAPTYNPYSLQP